MQHVHYHHNAPMMQCLSGNVTNIFSLRFGFGCHLFVVLLLLITLHCGFMQEQQSPIHLCGATDGTRPAVPVLGYGVGS